MKVQWMDKALETDFQMDRIHNNLESVQGMNLVFQWHTIAVWLITLWSTDPHPRSKIYASHRHLD